MKTFDFIQATISHNLKDPHSKALKPDCLSPFACDYDTASGGEGKGEGRLFEIGIWRLFGILDNEYFMLCALQIK
jgi:hypothetical protein